MPAKKTVKAELVIPEPGKAGRPQKEIDWGLFEELCGLHCTQIEIANILKIHIDTLRDRSQAHYGDEYSSVYKRYSDVGKLSLRRSQYKMAHTNTSMSIWLGKQFLGQRDHPIEDNTKTRTAFDEFNELMQKMYMQHLSEKMCEKTAQ